MDPQFYTIIKAVAILAAVILAAQLVIWILRNAFCLVLVFVACFAFARYQDQCMNFLADLYEKVESTRTQIPSLCFSRTSLSGDVSIKRGAVVNALDPELQDAVPRIAKCFRSIAGATYQPTITSGNDSEAHSRQSLHYQNRALDFRANNLPVSLTEEIRDSISADLGSAYLVLAEDLGTRNQHIHVQRNDSQVAIR